VATPARRATVEDLYAYKKKAELVNGRLVIMEPTGFFPGRAAGTIYRSLCDYEAQTRTGYAVPDNVGFLVDLPHRESFGPDAAYFVGEPTGMKFLEGAPVFAAEVRSEGDYGVYSEREMRAKRADYFQAGTQVVWDVDLVGEDVVRVYRAADPETPTVYRRGEVAEAEPALPSWRMAVDALFE
jgi:Uma2 family endonuclease